MPSLPDNEQSCNSHLAALVAINIVTQVLDEAEDILLAAHDSGQPWRYVWRQKKGNGEFFDSAEIINNTDTSEIIQSDNMIVTSTPQKETDHNTRIYNENSFIGQGDEHIQTRDTELKSPSVLIDCLFDMSKEDQTGNIEVVDDVQVNADSPDFLVRTVAKLVESFVNLALNHVCGEALIPEYQMSAEGIEESSHSSYSLLTDALVSDDTENENATYKIDNTLVKSDEDKHDSNGAVNDEDLQEASVKDIELYEKTFLTLNCDYEKSLEEEYFLPDGKNLVLQDVELLTNKSRENLASTSEATYILVKEENPSRAVTGTHKNSLVKRCRLQGTKLMSRLRSWWWKQRLVEKRKGCRSRICALSPKAQQHGASLLDHRKLGSPSPTRTDAWKFNTVNEALIHSYNINEFKTEPNDTVETD